MGRVLSILLQEVLRYFPTSPNPTNNLLSKCHGKVLSTNDKLFLKGFSPKYHKSICKDYHFELDWEKWNEETSTIYIRIYRGRISPRCSNNELGDSKWWKSCEWIPILFLCLLRGQVALGSSSFFLFLSCGLLADGLLPGRTYQTPFPLKWEEGYIFLYLCLSWQAVEDLKKRICISISKKAFCWPLGGSDNRREYENSRGYNETMKTSQILFHFTLLLFTTSNLALVTSSFIIRFPVGFFLPSSSAMMRKVTAPHKPPPNK